MTEFEGRVAAYIEQHRLVDEGSRIVVALSGGVDSVCLLSVLVSLGYDCTAAHCNYHLRGEESNRDEEHARGVAASLSVEIMVKHFDVSARCKRTGESVEMACRELRYEWFEELRVATGSAVIAVGHHREDNVETFLLNMLRGAGIVGAAGMDSRRGDIIRPLLGVGRAEIEAYVKDSGLGWVEDSSNRTNDYRRNRLRNVVLPALEDCFKGGTAQLARSVSQIAEGAAFFVEMVGAKRREYFDENQKRLDLCRLIKGERSARLLMVEWLREYGIDGSTVDDILSSSEESGRRFCMDDRGYWLLNRGELRYVKVEEEPGVAQEVSLDSGPFRMTVVDGREPRVVEDCFTALFDERILEGEPRFELRGWQRGDRMKPFGMSGTKKLSDLMRDKRIAEDGKHERIVLTRDGEIVWVIGLRHSRLFAVPEGAERFLRIDFIG